MCDHPVGIDFQGIHRPKGLQPASRAQPTDLRHYFHVQPITPTVRTSSVTTLFGNNDTTTATTSHKTGWSLVSKVCRVFHCHNSFMLSPPYDMI